MTPGTHGSTFGGNQLAMAAANAVLDIVADRAFLDEVKRKGLLFKQRLAEIRDRYPSVVAEVRGEGLLMGLRMVPPVGEMVDELRNEEMITVAAGDNVVRLLPPLIINDEEIGEAIRRIERACAKLAQAHPRQSNPAAKQGAVA
jgi:acetylornithine/N-succinyldiaminopimelate aminotransferase